MMCCIVFRVVHGYAHPVHMHGTHFYVMKTGYGKQRSSDGWLVASNADIDCSNPANPNCLNSTWTDPTWRGGNVPVRHCFSFCLNIIFLNNAVFIVTVLVLVSAKNEFTEVLEVSKL